MTEKDILAHVAVACREIHRRCKEEPARALEDCREQVHGDGIKGVIPKPGFRLQTTLRIGGRTVVVVVRTRGVD